MPLSVRSQVWDTFNERRNASLAELQRLGGEFKSNPLLVLMQESLVEPAVEAALYDELLFTMGARGLSVGEVVSFLAGKLRECAEGNSIRTNPISDACVRHQLIVYARLIREVSELMAGSQETQIEGELYI